MTADTAPAWDGVPSMPEVDGFHWLLKRNGAWPEAWLWQSDADGCGTEYSGAWAESDGDGQPDTMARWYSYLGPARTPAEVAALVEAARRDEREEIAAWHDQQALRLNGYAKKERRDSFEWAGFRAHAIEHRRNATAIRARSTEEQA